MSIRSSVPPVEWMIDSPFWTISTWQKTFRCRPTGLSFATAEKMHGFARSPLKRRGALPIISVWARGGRSESCMDVGHIEGKGGVDRGAERASRREHSRRSDSVKAPVDSAAISESGRETAAAIDELAAKARRDEPDREARVEAAKARLEAGELDATEVLRETARRMLDPV